MKNIQEICEENGESFVSIEDRNKEDNNLLERQFTIYRFKFTDDFMTEMYNFSKIHQYDDRNYFKEAWDEWKKTNDVIIRKEIYRLMQLGYSGDIDSKMFKSARYYFRKKCPQKNEPKTRKEYITISKELLVAIDEHILKNMSTEEKQPKIAFISFCNENSTILKKIVDQLIERGISDNKIIEEKIKKTYKNRYFVLINKYK